MTRITMLLALLLLLTVSTAVLPGQNCDITGTVPSEIKAVLCKTATSVHGGGAPVNQLTIMLRRSYATIISTKNMDAKNFMLTLLGAWKRGRKVKVARVEAYHGRAHLATAKTSAWSDDAVTFH